MRRIERAILELESLRDSVPASALVTPRGIAFLALLNTALNCMRQMQMFQVRHPDIIGERNLVSDLIRQVNREVRDEREAG